MSTYMRVWYAANTFKVIIVQIFLIFCFDLFNPSQGRGKSSHAFFHSLDEDHHVYINLQTLKVYILPESYEVQSSALDDIKYVVNPTFSREHVRELDRDEKISYDLLHQPYRSGFIGMNNIKQNDYMNVVQQALCHVSPIRDYFILENFDYKPQLGIC